VLTGIEGAGMYSRYANRRKDRSSSCAACGIYTLATGAISI